MRAGGFSLDLDSTVFERNGRQEGVLLRYAMRSRERWHGFSPIATHCDRTRALGNIS